MSLQTINNEIYGHLFPSERILLRPSEVAYDVNNIYQRQILLIGGQRSGKTATARMMALRACKLYGQNNVNAVVGDDFELLIEHGIQDKLVNILFFDDATLKKVNKDLLREYFRIRHVVKEATKRSYGLVVTVFGVHDYFALPKQFRTTCNVMLWKSPPTNPFDKRNTIKHIGEMGYALLQSIELLRDENPELIGVGVAYFLGLVGKFITPQATVNRLRKIEWAE